MRLIGAVGDDAFAEEALGGLVAAGVELELERKGQTGVALIYVDMQGENEIAVFPGANARARRRAPVEGAVLCQLEVPDEVVLAAAEKASFFALNAAPARVLDLEPDLLVVNRLEYEVVKRGKLVAVTDGADGAVLYEDGRQVAGSASPEIIPVDGTGAGDAFTACARRLAARGPALRGGAPPRLRGRAPSPPRRSAPRARCRRASDARGLGEADVMPTPIVIDCDPGHDDAIALLLALASPELELRRRHHRRRQPDAREDDGERAAACSSSSGRGDVPVAAGAAGPLVRKRTVAAHVHGESGLDGPELPAAVGAARSTSTPSTFLARHDPRARRGG